MAGKHSVKKSGVMIYGFIFLLLACAVFSSCDKPVRNTGTVDIETLKSNLSRETAPLLETGELEELVRGNTRFACDLFGRIRGTERNIFLSPHSISTALAMTYAGARGTTEQQMAGVLHFTLPQDRLHNAFNALDLELAKRPQAVEKDGFKLNICNAAWGQKDFPFLPDYLDILAVHYGSGLMALDFSNFPEESRNTVNNWVYEQTEERIKDLLPPGSITPFTTLVLTNAIYFKAGWLYTFEEKDTVNAPFYSLDGSSVTVPMMSIVESYGYAEESGYYQAVEILYKGEEVSMLILLPASGRYREFEASFNADFLQEIYGKISYRGVELKMPRFTFEWKASLVEILETLGMTDAFISGLADFSGIDGLKDLYIADVIHQSFVSVDEAGTEAAAATGVVIEYTSVPTGIPMTVNRPFIFLIRDKVTGAVLFLGRLLNPEA
jgi:serpin B